jgi:lipid II:glycine glycyltransferase (peptidoglycan interpeptide bridge formation enzyme)
MRHELERDPALWDAFAAASADPSYLQVTAWAAIKAPDGWGSLRVAVGGAHGPIGGQVLVQRPRPSPWGMGYMPRRPVSTGSLTPSDIRDMYRRWRYREVHRPADDGAGIG